MKSPIELGELRISQVFREKLLPHDNLPAKPCQSLQQPLQACQTRLSLVFALSIQYKLEYTRPTRSSHTRSRFPIWQKSGVDVKNGALHFLKFLNVTSTITYIEKLSHAKMTTLEDIMEKLTSMEADHSLCGMGLLVI